MTTIDLHKYHDQINHLLEDSQFSLAANHCRYILQQHPRHVDTYRLLARTLIEQGDYSGATELFQRVLSADPNDYIAHAGLSVVYREEDVLSQAIWHLERAYEIEPYNGAIQQELKNLYIDYSEQKIRKQQGEPRIDIPDSLPLTKGALARLYIRGEFYAQAIDILQKALAEDEDRIDLEVLLAEALWRDHQRKAAVQVCLQVLEKLPNCITANAVLAEIWLQIGRIEEAQDYLVELQALTLMDVSSQDLESPAGSAFKPDGAITLPAVFELERMGEDMHSLADAEAMGTVTNDSEITAEDDDEYQWLEGLGDELEVGGVGAPSEEPVSIMTDSDWLRRELEASDEETAVSEEISSWLDESTELDAGEEDAGVDALGIMAAGAVAAGVIGNQLKDDDEDSVVEEDSFDWLSGESIEEDIPEDDETIFAQIEHAEEAEEMPDWLSDMSGEDLEPVQVDPAEAVIRIDDDDDEMDYLSETDDEDGEENIYDWLEDAVSDEPIEELEPGELDLSQFAEFDEEEEEADEDEEIVWRLTDELNPPDEIETTQKEALDEFDFEVSPAETGELEDVPDWLMGSSGTDELDAASPTEEASSEIADELAEWVAANQPETDDAEDEDMDWLSGESEVPSTAMLGTMVEQAMEAEEEEGGDDFFTDDLPEWMADSSADIDDSAPLDSSPLISDEIVTDESSPLDDADLPDWLMGNSIDSDDSGFLETGGLVDEPDAASEASGDLPDWLVGGADDLSDEDEAQPKDVVDEDVLDWLSGEVETDETKVEEEDDGRSGTAVVGGLLGAAAAGLIAKELLDDDEEENEVTEDAVSDEQDDLIGPQDEPEEEETTPQEKSDEFDWLDDLDGVSLSADEEPLSTGDLGDGLDWMDLDDADDSGELNLDALLGLESEEETPLETEIEGEEPALAGLAEDESLDWLDALAGDEPEAVDEMPTWQWSEDGDEDPTLVSEESAGISDQMEATEPAAEDLEAIFDDEPAEAAVVEDLDDAMSWLEDLAAEPDAPVEELPSVAEDMDLDDFFAAGPDEAFLDDLSGASEQTETLDEIFAADTQNDSWLDGLAEDDEEPLPDFLQEDAEFELDEEIAAETAVSASELELTDDVGEPPEDLDDAMAWLEQLAARQGAPLDELPSVDAELEPEDDGLGAAEVVAGAAAGAAALGALDALFDDDDEEEDEAEPIAEMSEFVELDTVEATEDDLLAMDVPEDPDEAMAWLEKLAARQGAPLDELPSVSEDDNISTITEAVVEEDLFGLDVGETEVDDLLADADTISEFTEADDALGDLDDAMAWLDGLEDEEEVELIEVEEPVAPITDDLSDELDWLESVTSSDADTVAYNADEVSVSDDDLADALEKLTLLTVAAAAVVAVRDDEDELAVAEEGMVVETAVTEPEPITDIPADNFVEEMPEDPDEAMAWLEKLAARQGAPLDELPSVDEVEYDDLAAAGAAMEAEAETDTILEEPELVLETLIDEPSITETEEPVESVAPEEMDMDDAMAWLEQLAARQGTSLDELPTVDESDLEGDVAAPDWVADAQEQAEEEPLAEVEAPAIEEIEEIVAETPSVDESVDLPEDMDMDDAMAWLERLAARQGTSLDELPTVEDAPETDDDLDTPEWIAQQTGPLDSGVLDSLDIPEVSDETLDAASDEDFFAALDEIPAIEGIEIGVKDGSDTLAPDMEDIDDSMPDWLSGGEDSGDEISLGHTGWLNTLDEPDMGSWLAAEAEATSASDLLDDGMPEAVDTDSLISTGGLEETGSLQDSKTRRSTGELRLPEEASIGSMFTTELDEAQVLAELDLDDFGVGLDKVQLESARSSLAGGDIDAALHDYQGLVEAGESMHTVISDLERASELHQDKPLVRRMLGDAYMRNGQINKAIETYRNALDRM